MTNQTPIEEATGYLEARRYHNAILRQEDCAPIDTIHGKPLTARTVNALLEQIKLDEQRLTELRRQLDAAEAQPCDHDSDAFQALERLHARVHRDFNFDANESAAPDDERWARVMDDLVTFADEVYLPLADATRKPQRGPGDVSIDAEGTHFVVREPQQLEIGMHVWSFTRWVEIASIKRGDNETVCTDPAGNETRWLHIGYPVRVRVETDDAVWSPGANPFESVVTEALADIATTPADPEPAPAAPPWLVEAGDD